MKISCQRCSDKAVIHITEIEDAGHREVHLCYKHAQDYLREADEPTTPPVSAASAAMSALKASSARCPVCKLTFEEFRSSGRLGCAHDYEVFRDELRPLLENIHGALRHIGKVPRRLPSDARLNNQLIQLRQEMQQAVAVEDYERAARLRDQIDELERRH